MSPSLLLKFALAVAALVATGVIVNRIWQEGAETVRTAVERQNNASGDQSDNARGGYDLCVDGGGVWNYRTGKCSGSAPGRRY